LKEDSIYQALLGTAGLYTYWVLYVATGIACAYYVYQDAIKQDRRTLNIHPYWWAALALIGGVWTLLAYWLIQHSTLKKPGDE
jgi:hypothetical protein